MFKRLSLLIPTIVCFSALAAGNTKENIHAPQATACNVGQVYCYYEIVHDLQYPTQDLNNMYCSQTNDQRSCWGCSIWGCECKKGCWGSTWVCVAPYQFTYAASCNNDCKAGVCYEPEGFVKRRMETVREVPSED